MEKTAASKFGSSPAKLRFFTIFASDYPTDMNFRKISLLVLILLIADQALKIWVKTHMHLDESIVVFPDWFQFSGTPYSQGRQIGNAVPPLFARQLFAKIISQL